LSFELLKVLIVVEVHDVWLVEMLVDIDYVPVGGTLFNRRLE